MKFGENERLSDAKLLTTMTLPSADVTTLLDAWSNGDSSALGPLMDLVQKELHRMAGALFRRERQNHTLQPTALVNEVYIKLAGQRSTHWPRRAVFFGFAAVLMRRVLVDHARSWRTSKRGGGAIQIPLDDALGFSAELAPDILALHSALLDLERRSPRQARIVELKVMVGLKLEEIAAVEKVSRNTVVRDWKAARLFLLRQLRGS